VVRVVEGCVGDHDVRAQFVKNVGQGGMKLRRYLDRLVGKRQYAHVGNAEQAANSLHLMFLTVCQFVVRPFQNLRLPFNLWLAQLVLECFVVGRDTVGQ